MRSAALGLAVVLIAGLAVWATRALRTGEVDATRPGIPASGPVKLLAPGREACEAPLDLDRPVTRVGLALADRGRPGPPLDVTLRDAGSRAVLASAAIPKGWRLPQGQYYGVVLEHRVPAGRSVAVCARNRGRAGAQLVGKDESLLTAGLDGTSADWAVFFPLKPGTGRSYLGMAGDFARRASVLRPGIVSPAVYWVLAALLLVGAPFALWRAVVSAD